MSARSGQPDAAVGGCNRGQKGGNDDAVTPRGSVCLVLVRGSWLSALDRVAHCLIDCQPKSEYAEPIVSCCSRHPRRASGLMPTTTRLQSHEPLVQRGRVQPAGSPSKRSAPPCCRRDGLCSAEGNLLVHCRFIHLMGDLEDSLALLRLRHRSSIWRASPGDPA